MKIYFLCALLTGAVTTQAATQKGFETEFYGFIKASSLYSSEALASYNNINLSAPTHAVARTRSTDSISRLSFQTQQSRLGVDLKKDEHLSAKFEFDFIDFSKSSPTTQMNPRVRVASMTYAFENQKIIIGQDWDLFSPVTSFTFDYVGLYFLAGNTGFMRSQVQYLITRGNWEYGAALGMAGNNPGISDTDLELGKSPTYSARVSYTMTDGRVGLSGIYAHLSYTSNDSSHDAYGYNAFFEKVFSETTLKSEAYYGQNLANIGSLALGKGTATSDVKEYGATLTGIHKLTQKNSPFAGIGLARVDNRSQLNPFLLPPTGSISNPGIRANFLVRLGWEYKVTEDFSWVSEISRFETVSKLTDNSYQTNIAGSLESGIQLRF